MADPILCFLIAKVCFFYGIGFVDASSPLRPVLFFVIALTCFLSLRSPSLFLIPGAVGNDYIAGFVFHASNFLLVARRTPPPSVVATRSAWSNARWAFKEIFAARWDIARIPPFSEKDPTHVPSRRNLFLRRLVDFAWTASLACYLELNQPLDYQDYTASTNTHLLSRWPAISRRELLVRIYLAFKGNCIPYLGLRAGHSLTTCVALAFGARPEEWPPLYGRLSDAYTVRRWYSHFWHHAMRRALVSHASFLTRLLLVLLDELRVLLHKLQSRLRVRLPFLPADPLTHPPPKPYNPSSPTARYLTTTLAFLLSAFMHILSCPRIEWCMLVPQLRLHLGTATAVVSEDVLIAAYGRAKRRLAPGPPKTRKREGTGVELVVATNEDGDSEMKDARTSALENHTFPRTKPFNDRNETVAAGPRKRTRSRKARNVENVAFPSVRRWREHEARIEKRETEMDGKEEVVAAKRNGVAKGVVLTHGRGQLLTRDIVPWYWRLLGYVWVAVFWTWAVPPLMFSLYNC